MMVPKHIDIWIADAEGTAIAGPILGEMRWRDKILTGGDHIFMHDYTDIAVAPTRGVIVPIQEDYRFPFEIQAYDLDDDETLLGTWPLWLILRPGDTLALQPWMKVVKDAPSKRVPQCCCRWGAAIRGEWPEFVCLMCPKHGEEGEPVQCKRHLRQMGVKR